MFQGSSYKESQDDVNNNRKDHEIAGVAQRFPESGVFEQGLIVCQTNKLLGFQHDLPVKQTDL